MYDDLTLGTVVSVVIEKQSYKIMIVAKDLSNKEGLNIDYMGVVYPYGHVEGQDMVYFNKDLIKGIIHRSEKDKAVMFLEEFTRLLSEENDAKRDISNRE